MRLRDALLATLTSLIWGFGFVAIKVGVESFSAPQLTALRFLVGAVPVLFVPRPRISWPQLVLIGLFLFTGAFSWAVGNILVKRLPAVPVLSLVVWASLVPPLPAFLVSAAQDRTSLPAALAGASWPALGAVLYLGLLATVLAYALWGDLLQRYPAARVAPFALLAPCAGILSSTLILGEVFSLLRYAGMALILAGLAAIVLAPAGPAAAEQRRLAD